MEFSKKNLSKKIYAVVKKIANSEQQSVTGFLYSLIHIVLIFEGLKVTG